jgi:transcriptional regulator with XRE-family HTH domain
MTKSLNEFKANLPLDVKQQATSKAAKILAEMTLAETRRSRGLNQSVVAERLNIAQPNVSQIESRSDSLLSSLSQYVEALGGTLELHAKFPNGQDVEIIQFQNKP